MDEDHGVNPHLNDFYDFMSKGIAGVNPHAFPMQRFFMNKRFERELSMGFKDGLLIQDRCMLEQLEIFNRAQNADGLMSDEQFAEIEKEFNEKLSQIVRPQCIIFLDCKPQVNMDRIAIRNRPGEAGKITVEYISKLGQFYEKFLERVKAEI